MTTPAPSTPHIHDPGFTPDELAHQSRHIVRLLIALYHLGTPTRSLWEGETRQVDSIWSLQRFEFWLREPGHLALALLRLAETSKAHSTALRETVAQMLIDDSVDRRRVHWPGAPLQSLPDLQDSLSFVSSRALVSDRPSFGSGGHQIVLETPGVEFVRRVLESCPSFGWYDFLGAAVSRYWSILNPIDLASLPYLQPDLTPAQAAKHMLIPFIRRRYEALPPDSTPSAATSASPSPAPRS